MVAEIGDPTGDTGKGSGETAPETWRARTTGTAQDSVADKVVTLVGEMEITTEAEVCEGVMVTTTTPPTHQDRQNMWCSDHNCREGGRSE